MKTLFLLMCLLITESGYTAGCIVSNFRGTVLSIHLESKRAEAAAQWLRSEVDDCSVEKLSIIRNGSRSWLGTALNPQIEALIEAAIEAKAADDPELLKRLFEPVVPGVVADSGPSQSASASSSSPTPRAPVVAPATTNVSVTGNVTYIDAKRGGATKGSKKDEESAGSDEPEPSYQRKVEIDKQVRWSREMEQKISAVKAETDVARKLKRELLDELSAAQPERSYQQRVQWEQGVRRRFDELVNLAKQ